MTSTIEIAERVYRKLKIRNPTDKAMLALVTLGLIAAFSDGDPEDVEIQTLRNNIANRYLKESNEIIAFIELALKRVKNSEPNYLAESSCAILKEEMNQAELLEIFHFVSDILVSDGKVHPGEKEYLALVANKFELEDILVSVNPQLLKS